MRVVACDVGKLNFALCCLEHEGPPYQGGLSLLNCEAAALRGQLKVLHWVNLRLTAQKRPTFAQTLQGVVDLIDGREALFRESDFVVIESQMTASMKAISAAFFAALRSRFPTLTVLFQHGGVKLSFGDLQAALGGEPLRLDTYALRKRAAVRAARHFCQQCPSALPSEGAPLEAAKKADDLADALLHGLAFLALRSPQTPAQRGARTKRTLSEVEHPSA